MRLNQLYLHCADLGIDVEHVNLGPTRRGEYLANQDLIRLHYGLTRAQATSTLAHEVGHAVFGDTCSSRKAERRAWMYGAALIINVKDYEHAERVMGHHVCAIAAELGVTRRLVEAWQEWFQQRPQ